MPARCPADRSEEPTEPGTRSTAPRPRLSRRRLLLGTGALVGAGAAALIAGRQTAATIGTGADTNGPLYARCTFGAYADNAPYPDVRPHYVLENTVGARLPTMSWFQDFGAPWQHQQAADASASAHDLCIAWQPKANGTPIAFGDLLAGRWDQTLRTFFRAAAQFPGRVILRPFWEMNASAARYSMNYRQTGRQVHSIEEFRHTWRYLVQLQRDVGGPRVAWFFCANGNDVGPVRMEDYWPGGDVVDEVGFDTYNDNWSPWTSFHDKVAPMYDRFELLAPSLPMRLGEIGCKETDAPPGESKSTWLQDMFLSRDFPRLTHICFFHAKKAIDSRLDSSPATLETCQRYLRLASIGGRASLLILCRRP